MNDQIKARDRAETLFVGSIPEGDYNRDVEAKAVSDGIVIDDYMLIPWGWVLRALAQQYEDGPFPDFPASSEIALTAIAPVGHLPH